MRKMPGSEINPSRFSLRPVTVDDFDALYALFLDEAICRYPWDGMAVSLETTREIVEKIQCLFEESGFGVWRVREGDAAVRSGFAGYWHFRNPPVLELFYGAAPLHWKRGIATECGGA